MKARELINLGIPKGDVLRLAQELIAAAARDGHSKSRIRRLVAEVVADPERHVDHRTFGPLAEALLAPSAAAAGEYVPRAEPAPWRQWGEDLEPQSVEQMVNACTLPIAVSGALMPDAHLGYGLPIGGVLATNSAVIPYAVGVDIACRMKMSVLDMPVTAIEGQTDRLANAIEAETRFGIGAAFERPRDHPVMDADWSVTEVTAAHKDKARKQLGTSGSGNHFVEFGVLTVSEPQPDLPVPPGRHLALLSHSGSRGTGSSVADHFSRLAMARHPELPRPLRHLAWLDLDDEDGQAYWAAMSLMGEYAAANHACIHRAIARHLRADVLADVENHHNFAWRERHDDRDVIVHRKGATPAGRGVLGIIPGSMASPCYVVRGLGSEPSLRSASHGAGRVMSRRQAKSSFTWSDVKKQLAAARVRLLSAGLDEVPGVYKDIDVVMAQQRDLVEVIARFDPRIVKMAPGGRAED
jgi:tRNA-splicing ligase RtcB